MKEGDVVICNTDHYKGLTQNKRYVVKNTCFVGFVKILEVINDEKILFFYPSHLFDFVECDNNKLKSRKSLMMHLFSYYV